MSHVTRPILMLLAIVVAGCASSTPGVTPRPSTIPIPPMSTPAPSPSSNPSATATSAPHPSPSPSGVAPSPTGAVIVTFRVAEKEVFKALLTDPANIATVRDLLACKEGPTIPNGRIVYETGVNTGYHWSMDPADIRPHLRAPTSVCPCRSSSSMTMRAWAVADEATCAGRPDPTSQSVGTKSTPTRGVSCEIAGCVREYISRTVDSTQRWGVMRTHARLRRACRRVLPLTPCSGLPRPRR